MIADAQPFDAAADLYDDTFTNTGLGRWLRDDVRGTLASAFHDGDSVLELGCGTGADAVWLAGRGTRVTATDAAPRMLEQTRARAATAGMTQLVRVVALDMNEPVPDALFERGALDGAFSSFGAFNCVKDRRRVVHALADWLRPGARVVLVVMGPLCAWEIGWHLARGRVKDAFRRLRHGADAHVGGGAMAPVWYPAPATLRAELEPEFRHVRTRGVGVLLPPSYLAALVDRRRRMFERAARVERSWLGGAWSAHVADHYISEFERT